MSLSNSVYRMAAKDLPLNQGSHSEGGNPTPNSPAVEVGTDIFIRVKYQVIEMPQEIGSQLHRRLNILMLLNLTH